MMQWINAILRRHMNEEGILDVEAATAEINETFPRHAVPKATFNAKLEEIKELKASADKAEALEKQVQEYAAKEAKANKEAQVKDALEKAGVTDADYMIYKLGDLEVGEDGKIPFLDNQIKDLKDKFPAYFAEKGDEGKGGEPDDGFKPVDGKLAGGKEPDKNLSNDFMSAFTADLNIQK